MTLFRGYNLVAVRKHLEENNATEHEQAVFMDYVEAMSARLDLYAKYPGATIINEGSKEDKNRLNALSWELNDLENIMKNTPIFQEMIEKYGEDLPEFLTEDVYTRAKDVATQIGWYQNSKGDLYHYDGTIWDNVPEEKINNLEFLG